MHKRFICSQALLSQCLEGTNSSNLEIKLQIRAIAEPRMWGYHINHLPQRNHLSDMLSPRNMCSTNEFMLKATWNYCHAI